VVAANREPFRVATVDVSSRDAVLALVGKSTGIGEIVGLIHAAGVSPSQASPEMVLDDRGSRVIRVSYRR
jgi:acetolactate synthase small subunit